jgi:hypothetical protein
MTVIYGGKMAFPIHNTGHGAPFDEGMSLRDYIAIQAMNGLLSGLLANGMDIRWSTIARDSYYQADLMLEHRVSGEQ